MKCNAKTRSGTLCQKPPLEGKSRCRLHGGLSPSGKKHWNYKHGECSKVARAKDRDIASELRLLNLLMLELGMIDAAIHANV